MIEIENLSFGYKSAAVLQNVSLKLEEGNIYGLLGENGAGKTTLMKIILGLQKGEGKCLTGGYRPFDRLPGFLENIFYVPEDIAVGDITVDEYAFSLGRFYPRWDAGAYRRYIGELEVPARRWFSRMSAGQKKKGIIAVALATNTGMLLMDEPTNGLDIPSKSRLREIVSRYASDERIILISTHQVRDLEGLMDHIVVLGRKEVCLNLSVREICSKISFVHSASAVEGALYCEAVPGGFVSVVTGDHSSAESMDTEVFFNAVVNNPSVLTTMYEQ